MGVWQIGTDTLAQSRFSVSALAETIASFHLLEGRGAAPGRPAHTPAQIAGYRERLAADPVLALFVRTVVKPNWMPDFMSPPPRPEDRTFHDELRSVRQTPATVALADMTNALGGPVPAVLAGPDLPNRVADLLQWVWSHTVRSDWPDRRRIFEADIVSRTQQISTGGWAAALSGMRPGMRWIGDGRLQINTYENPPRDITGAQLLFIPTTARRGWVAWDQPHRYAVVYPCAGLLAETAQRTAPRALSALLGPVRATVLSQLDTPKSTTQLVAIGGYGLGTVGRHLKILFEARLVSRRRSGRSVLYYRTPTGDQLVRKVGSSRPPRSDH
ncbi:ArsR family transcriptional regulator [Micromonospora rifamycinica]|uniref:ArsR/SmtB family transcription factor n=1 Tax=Micromonospora rifamycinica TaxID=291594 RepID=UPI002E29C0B5|nr:helix-turn-helix transcriptional regulator [Micromonospora rifamycinica]